MVWKLQREKKNLSQWGTDKISSLSRVFKAQHCLVLSSWRVSTIRRLYLSLFTSAWYALSQCESGAFWPPQGKLRRLLMLLRRAKLLLRPLAAFGAGPPFPGAQVLVNCLRGAPRDKIASICKSLSRFQIGVATNSPANGKEENCSTRMPCRLPREGT